MSYDPIEPDILRKCHRRIKEIAHDHGFIYLDIGGNPCTIFSREPATCHRITIDETCGKYGVTGIYPPVEDRPLSERLFAIEI